jgi:transcriptional regulator with XRE-family HTH domain
VSDDRSYLREFGLNVKVARVKAELTQEELAERAGMHRTTLGQIERGQRALNVAALGRLAEALGVHGRDLLP